jgi:hypothetical protein
MITFNTHSSRVQKFGAGSRILRSRTPLTDTEIQAVAPSIFADRAHGSRSTRYQHIPTSEVLGSLRREGFQPFMVSQGGSRDEEKRGFTKHMLRLRHESQSSVDVGGTFREIVLVNSHDGTSSYQLMSGVFRMVCENGLISGSIGNDIRVRHNGSVVDNVIEGCTRILDDEWTVVTTDGSRAAHWEHTVAVTDDGPRILTV